MDAVALADLRELGEVLRHLLHSRSISPKNRTHAGSTDARRSLPGQRERRLGIHWAVFAGTR
jgi:hypothetical protein